MAMMTVLYNSYFFVFSRSSLRQGPHRPSCDPGLECSTCLRFSSDQAGRAFGSTYLKSSPVSLRSLAALSIPVGMFRLGKGNIPGQAGTFPCAKKEEHTVCTYWLTPCQEWPVVDGAEVVSQSQQGLTAQPEKPRMRPSSSLFDLVMLKGLNAICLVSQWLSVRWLPVHVGKSRAIVGIIVS